mmetsp:Transcript_29126/g.41214  ORF Transcript_29126/g.41214 Transcript_29126/m.41214 type:complete len:93 (-) Transcript_29126:746-1024(-)
MSPPIQGPPTIINHSNVTSTHEKCGHEQNLFNTNCPSTRNASLDHKLLLPLHSYLLALIDSFKPGFSHPALNETDYTSAGKIPHLKVLQSTD